MLNKIKVLIAGLVIMGSFGFTNVYADVSGGIQGGIESTDIQSKSGGKLDLQSIVKKVTNLLLWAVGAVSVIMLIYGGFKYTTSGGDAGKVGEAKNTILYAIIGVVVSLLSYAIIQFVLEQFN